MVRHQAAHSETQDGPLTTYKSNDRGGLPSTGFNATVGTSRPAASGPTENHTRLARPDMYHTQCYPQCLNPASRQMEVLCRVLIGFAEFWTAELCPGLKLDQGVKHPVVSMSALDMRHQVILIVQHMPSDPCQPGNVSSSNLSNTTVSIRRASPFDLK